MSLGVLSPGLARADDGVLNPDGNKNSATGANTATGEVVISENARAHFRAGVNLLQDPDGARYDEAYQQFVIAYEDSPSWKILSNLGLAAMKLERDGEAIEAFETYMKEAADQLSADEKAQITRDLETLHASAVSVSIRTNPGGARLIDERTTTRGVMINEYQLPPSGELVLKLRSGRHKLTTRLTGHEDVIWEVQLTPGAAQAHTFTLTPLATTAVPSTETNAASQEKGSATPSDGGTSNGMNGLRIGSYIAFGVGAVGLGLGTVFALDSKKAHNRVNELCVNDPETDCRVDPGSPEEKEVNEKNDQAGSSQTMAIVGLAVGGVAIATGVTLFVLSMKNGKSTAQMQHDRDTHRYLAPLLGFNQVGLSGRF